jgi:hypothetical protein
MTMHNAGSSAAQGPVCAVLLPNWRWVESGHDKVRVWYQTDRPADLTYALDVLDRIDRVIWPQLTGLMAREPLPDVDELCNGTSGLLDLYLVPAQVRAQAVPSHSCDKTAGYVLLPEAADPQDVAHEFMHTIQFAYEPANGCASRRANHWWMEASAEWAGARIADTLFPGRDLEHRLASALLDGADQPLDTDTDPHVYGAYLWPFYLDQGFTPQWIRQIFEATEHMDSLAAIDSVIGGGFQERWPEFVRRNWNQVPLDQYKQWDRLEAGAKPAQDWTVAGTMPAREDVLPVDVPHLAARYYHFSFKTDDARSIAFRNGSRFAHEDEPTAHVQALYKLEGEQNWRPYEDWTKLQSKAFCRDKKSERLQELLIIVSNSEWQDPAKVLDPGDDPKVVMTNIGCWSWEGEATGTYINKGAWTMVSTAKVTFERSRSPGMVEGYGENYHLVKGSMQWTMNGAIGDCIVKGGPTNVGLSQLIGDLSVDNDTASGPVQRGYSGSGSASTVFTYSVICPDSTFHNPWIGASFFGTFNTALHVSNDGKLIQNKTTKEDQQFKTTYTWSFKALRE